MEDNLIWLVKLLLAHFISDFLLQKSAWIEDKNTHKIKSKYLYWHILITGLLALALIGLNHWETVLIITSTHYIIDLIKSYLPQNFKYFILDQIIHVGIIFLCWSWTFELLPTWEMISDFYYQDHFWIVALCFLFLTYPSGYIIANSTKIWSDQVINLPNNTGLANAGKYIGFVERIIICILVYQDQYEAIGLLIAGKSILRYNIANEEIKTEYLLVGTLISIFIAIVVGLLLKWLL